MKSSSGVEKGKNFFFVYFPHHQRCGFYIFIRRMDMKKIWLVVVLLFGFITLAGCTTDDESDSFILEVINLEGDVLLLESIPFESGSNLDIIALIDEFVGLDYTEFSLGTFINGIGNNYPTEYGVTYNYYYSLFVNGVSSTVGLDQVVVSDGTKISFIEVTLLDEVDLEVDRLIQTFINTYADTYISSTQMEFHVAAAFHQLHRKGYDVPALSAWVNDLTPLLSRDTIQNTMRTAIYESLFQRDKQTTKTTLEGYSPTNHYEAMSVLTGLSIVGGSNTQIQSLISQIIASNPTYMDSDYAGMALLALASYREQAILEQAIEGYLDFILLNLTSTGITAWGSPNSSSTAAVVLGLVAHGIHPRSEAYQTAGVDLIEALLLYSHDGAFKWTIDAETADLQFSTPQVFAALVAYKLYRDVYGNPPFSLFDFAS
jgi:hypothetical protein